VRCRCRAKVLALADGASPYATPPHPSPQGFLATGPLPGPGIERQRPRAAPPGDGPTPPDPRPGCRFTSRCPLAFDRCFEEEPPLADLGRKHHAACFLAQPEAATRAEARAT